MALVTGCMNTDKPATSGGKLTPAPLNIKKDLEVDMKKEEPSFLAASLELPRAKSRKRRRAHRQYRWRLCGHVLTLHAAVTCVTSRRETLKTEVICASSSTHRAFTTATHLLSTELLIHSYFNIVKRETIDMGHKSHLTHACQSLEGELAARAAAGALQA